MTKDNTDSETAGDTAVMADTDLPVFVVDDDRDVRTSLPRALRKRGFTVEVFDSARSFMESCDNERPGCLVLDYRMPGMSGLELQKHMNDLGYSIPIIFISGHGGVPESVQAIKGGAVDFLEKPFRPAVLAERINAACKLLVVELEARAECAQLRAKFDRLTQRESEIVARMVENPAEISSKEIGRFLGISPRTIDHHRARILEKLEIKSAAELIDLAGKLERICS